jgi:hypothetical protein
MAEVTADSSAYMAFSHAVASQEPVINSGSFGGSAPDAKFDKASAVSAALAAYRFMGEYITSGDFGTEWVVTFPNRYAMVSDNDADAPFGTIETASDGMACEHSTITHRDREGKTNSENFIMGPPPNLISYCYAVNVHSGWDDMNSEYTDVVSSKAVKQNFNLEFEDGWAYVGWYLATVTPTVFTAGDDSGVVRGLPLIGFIAVADMVAGLERGGVFPLRVMADEQ